MPGGAVFLRCNPDHHGIALFKATEANAAGAGMHHLAFEVADAGRRGQSPGTSARE